MEAEDYAAGCCFSLMCQEDGADLGDSFTSNDGGDLLLMYSGTYESENDEEEYMDHLVSKESSLCSSPESSLSCSSADESSPSMASADWFQCARRSTVKWILETRGHFGFCHRTAYVAIGYFDRFSRRRCVDRSVMPWAARLLAIACVSLAAKMDEYQAPALSEFSADGDYEFCCDSIRRMELLVLSTLDWRMGAVTPFDYLPCLSSRLRRGGGGGGGGLVAAKAAALIFSAAEVASVLDYRPSTVAVAAVLAATHGVLTKEALESRMSNLSPSCLLDKEDAYPCYTMMLGDPSSTATNKPTKRSAPDPIDAAAASFSVAAAMNNNKRVRLDLPGTLHR
ncbi:cyclin-D5-2 [Lolium perenne]|uniref:cyclin-D5-2 n=1 Tax=Lolium perenne TaxID=4522 RepID=UPI0021EB2F9A|nr:cyclin-D5-1-like [Lolium perenne]